QLDLPDAWVARRYETLWFRVAAPELPVAYDLSLDVPGAVELPDGRVLRLSLSTEQGGESASIAEFSVADLSAPLRVRSWQSGDRFVPQGMTGHKRLKCYFSDNKIELEERLRVPVLVSGETIIWLGGMRRSNQKVASLDGGTILRVELL
ncbi:MAG: tRNA lysidine(34) synthetase TilS, partial [Desulfuromonadales bacterium]|nr:tRNA lysidine(34) synthetase TilS [Desulfuromonadales bacterium]